jgi:transcriptional regulator with XRE-family HTH domain
MILSQRLRQLRQERNLSQGDIEKRSGLLRCYVSRVENGITVPSLVNLERIASALEVPMYRLFYNGDGPPETPKTKIAYPTEWGASGPDADFLRKFRTYVGKTSPRNRMILLALAYQMARPATRAQG